jgi:signal transduction histidine kinase
MLPRDDGHALRKGLDELHATMALALDEVYGLIESLGGRDSDDTDLVSRVRTCIGKFTERFGIDVDLSVEGDCGTVSPSLQIATFRIVQEALSNIGRHAGASRVGVALRLSTDEMCCEISDDGRGFDTDSVKHPGRRREAFGLRSMRERAQMLDGECVVESSPGHGARVLVRIPVWQG